jgi:hypothetical protein
MSTTHDGPDGTDEASPLQVLGFQGMGGGEASGGADDSTHDNPVEI